MRYRSQRIMTNQSTGRPNILFLLPDQHRFDWLGTNPVLPLRTPNLDRLGAQGVRFARAITPSPLCAPARACLAAGREYDRCGVPNNKFDYPLSQPTYYQALRDAGYRVAGVGKFDLHKATLDWGLDGSRLIREWGFTEGIDNEGKMDAIASAAGRAAASSGNSAVGQGDAATSAAGRVAAPEDRPALRRRVQDVSRPLPSALADSDIHAGKSQRGGLHDAAAGVP